MRLTPPIPEDSERGTETALSCTTCREKVEEIFRSCKAWARRPRTASDAQLTQDAKFEQHAERDMLKFELGYIGVEAAALFIYAILAPGRAWPHPEGFHLWPAGCVSIALRVAGLPFRMHVRSQAHILAAVLLLVDIMLITSCHPNCSGVVWWDSSEPELPTDEHLHVYADDVYSLTRTGAYEVQELQVTKLQRYQRHLDIYMTALDELERKKEDEHTMVLYSLQLVVWYMTTFVLMLRHAAAVLPLGFLIVCSGSLGLWRDELDPKRGAGLELTLLAFSMTVAVAAKARFETSQRAVFSMVEEKKSEAIKERVLRYEAEFKNEQGKGGLLPAPTKVGTPSLLSAHSTVNSTMKSGQPPSIFSAPAAVRTGPVMSTTRRAGECLPPESVVWVEGHGLPLEVEHISPGQKVLCYDNLTQCPKYVEVLEATSLFGQAPWVEVALSDGTTLTLTSDHPTQPVRAKQLPESVYVPASDLQPKIDSLMVLKMLPVTVNTVTPKGSGKQRRVALALRQPDRHEVFASPSRSSPGQEFSTMAIGSADVLATGKAEQSMMHKKGYGLTVKRTFIDFDTSDAVYARSNSCPASFRMIEKPSGASRRKENATRVAWADDVGTRDRGSHPPIWKPRLQRTFSDSEITSITSMSSKQSSSPSDAEVLVAVGNAESAACVSELLAVGRSGLPSRGSRGHAVGECHACVFESRWHVGEGQRCFKGALCERCHECHEPLGKKKRMSGAMRSYRKWQRSQEQGEEN